MQELRLVGTPDELTANEIYETFFRSAEFYLRASDASLSKEIILMEIDGRLFCFSLSIPKGEAAGRGIRNTIKDCRYFL